MNLNPAPEGGLLLIEVVEKVKHELYDNDYIRTRSKLGWYDKQLPKDLNL